jgi:hypothetical protein
MSMFSTVYLDPVGFIAWLVVGLLAGWLAGVMMKGSGYGLAGDVISRQGPCGGSSDARRQFPAMR